MEEWVSARELRIALGDSPERLRYRGGASYAICRRAHEGLLRARAKLVVWKQGERKSDADVPREFWWAGGHEALDQDWALGDFTTWLQQKHEVKIFGAHFSKQDALEMGAAFSSGSEEYGDLTPTQSNTVVGRQKPPETELTIWVSNMVLYGVAVRHLNIPVLKATWPGSANTVPTLESAKYELNKAYGDRGPGRPPSR